MMKTLVTTLTAFALLAFLGCSRSKEGGNYAQVASEDSAMNKAIATAKESSADFVRAFHEQKPGTKDFFVKKPYRTPNGGSEHMWIEVTGENDGILQGVIANEAEETREVKAGQRVSLKISEISDWKYQDGKKLIGAPRNGRPFLKKQDSNYNSRARSKGEKQRGELTPFRKRA